MRNKWKWALAVPLVAAGIAVLSQGRAADHLDGPGAKHDPAADITDVYAFMSPQATTPNHVVLVQNVFPIASTTSKFSDKVDYFFRVRKVTGTAPITLDTTALDVKCNVTGSPQSITCTAPGGLTKTVAVGTAGACAVTDNICVYAGLKSDPFYFDLAAFNKSVMMNSAQFTTPGVNFFAGLNVLTIVVELNATTAFGANAIVAVSAETNRTGN